MKIDTIWIQNFRCIKDEILNFSALTALVGRNGSGKSTFLLALKIFYEGDTNYSEEDYFNKDITKPIIITITYNNLTEKEKTIFASYLEFDKLIIEKQLLWPRGKNSQKYFGYIKRHSIFEEIHKLPFNQKLSKYNEIRGMPGYADLPILTGRLSNNDFEQAMQTWETNHQDLLQKVHDDGEFFGFNDVGEAKLEQYTRFIYVPAVRDASQDANEGKDSLITDILDIVIRNTFDQRDDVKSLKEDVNAKYTKILAPEGGLIELNKLQTDLDKYLRLLAPESKLSIIWKNDYIIDIPPPSAYIKIIEDGYITTIDRVGNGLQRAFIWSILQYYTIQLSESSKMGMHIEGSQEQNKSEDVITNFILGIEEIELYQHPTRQRYLAKMMLKLSKEIQIMYTTHSPLFIDFERFDQIRLVHKVNGNGLGNITQIHKTDLGLITRKIEEIESKSPGTYTSERMRAKLRPLFTPWTNEGFFSDFIILVEGEEDRTVLLNAINSREKDFETKGISFDLNDVSIIPCNGKNNLAKAVVIFNSFNIPTYTIWDWDSSKEGVDGPANKQLIKLFNINKNDFPKTMITKEYTCFEEKISEFLKKNIDQKFYNEILKYVIDNYEFPRDKNIEKTPIFIELLLKEAKSRSIVCKPLENLLDNICLKCGSVRKWSA